MVSVLFVLVITCCTCVKAATYCKRGWLADEGFCYLFGTLDVHFTEAEHFCRQHGGHLVDILNTHENNFLKTHLTQMKVFEGVILDSYWWIGLTDESVKGEWRWFNSDALTNFTDWGPGDPNDYKGVEDCVVMVAAFGYAWGDISCVVNCHPLCKMSGLTCSDEVVVGK